MKTKLKIVYGVIGLLFLYISGCTDEPKGNKEYKPITLTEGTRAAANELKNFNVEFTVKVSEYVDNSNIESRNVIVSPLSASMLLSMVANSTTAPLSEEIIDVLGVSDINNLNALCSVLSSALPIADSKSKLVLSNSLWYREGLSLNHNYSSLLSEFYGAELNETNFSNQKKALDAINGWCSKETNGLIPTLKDEIDANTIAILLNATYFKSVWKEEYFSEKDTKKEDFYGSKGVSKIDMMHAKSETLYYNHDDYFQYFCLPFGNGAYSMNFFLPKEDLTSKESLEKLTGEEYNFLRSTSVDCILTLGIPKFKNSMNLNLNSVLKAYGINDIDSEIQLTMFETDMYARQLIGQITYFEINEKGVEAAAVSYDGMVTASPLPGEKYEITLNRPFFFFITENSTGACILSGRIMDI